MVNKYVDINWVFGSKHWLIEDGFIVDQQTGKVLDIEGEVFSPGREVIVYPKHGGANQKWEVVPTDDWMKLRNPKSGLYLQLTNNGQGLTVEGKIHTVYPETSIKKSLVYHTVLQRIYKPHYD